MHMKGHATELDGIIGRNIRFYRQQLGWSCARLGEIVGVSFEQVRKYESGANRVAASTLFKIADILHVPMQAFREPRACDTEPK
jgi:transcriptional regulator with XRE-family HTH domain